MTSTPTSTIPPITFETRRRERHRWLWITLLALALAAGTVGVVWAVQRSRQSHQRAQSLTSYTVARGDLNITVTESGTLKARKSQQLWADIQGRARVAWLREEGVYVDSGDVLVIMETEELEKAISDAQIELEQAVAARIQAEEKLDIQDRQNTSDIQAAEVKLQIAELELERYQSGEVPKLLREARLKVDKCTVDLQLAQEDLVGMEDYVAKGYFTKKDFEQRKLALREATEALETARKDLELLQQFQIPKDQAQKRSEVDQAKTNLDLVVRKAKSELAQKQADAEQRRFIERLRVDRLKELQERLSKMQIRAPSAGLVIYGDDSRWYTRRDIQVGMDVWRGRVIMTLPDLSEMDLLVSINEVDLDKVEEGQSAKVVLDAYPSLVFTGHVTRVGQLAERQSRGRFTSDVPTFEVNVAIDMHHARTVLARVPSKGANSDSRLRPGMSAKAEIEVTTLRNVLYVPVDAVFEEAGTYGCYRLVDGKPVWQPVTIGLNNRTHVHIRSGLEQHDVVLRYDPTLAAGRRRPTTRPATTQPAGERTRPATTQPRANRAGTGSPRGERGSV